MGHSEESGEDAGELNDAFCAGRNALGAPKSGREMSSELLEVQSSHGVFRWAEEDGSEIGQMTD